MTDSSDNVALDSLPYIDPVHEEYEKYALSLIEEEMKSIQPPKLPKKLSITTQSPLLQEEIKKLKENNKKKNDFAVTRAQAPSDEKNVDSWNSALSKAKAEYQAELLRSQALEASNSTAATNAWQAYIRHLEAMVQDMDQQGQREKAAVDEINHGRQVQQQESYGRELDVLQIKYKQRLDTKHQLALATRNLESEVEELKNKTVKSSD